MLCQWISFTVGPIYFSGWADCLSSTLHDCKACSTHLQNLFNFVLNFCYILCGDWGLILAVVTMSVIGPEQDHSMGPWILEENVVCWLKLCFIPLRRTELSSGMRTLYFDNSCTLMHIYVCVYEILTSYFGSNHCNLNLFPLCFSTLFFENLQHK